MIIDNELPEMNAFAELFFTTGWELGLSDGELYEAISNSWYVISVYEDEQLIGFGRIVSDGVYQAMICDVIVLPDYQGKGIGTKIMEIILKKCRNHKIRMVVLMSAKGKAEFYRRFGFKERDLDAPGMILTE